MCVRGTLNISDSHVQEKKIRGGSKLFPFSINVSLQLKINCSNIKQLQSFSEGRHTKLFDAIWGLPALRITIQPVDTPVIIYDTHAHYPGDAEQWFPLVGSERFEVLTSAKTIGQCVSFSAEQRGDADISVSLGCNLT